MAGVSGHFEVGDGGNVVMRLPSVAYGALYQTGLVDRVLDHVKDGNMGSAWSVVDDAMALARSLDCPWCQQPGLHEACWEIPMRRDA